MKIRLNIEILHLLISEAFEKGGGMPRLDPTQNALAGQTIAGAREPLASPVHFCLPASGSLNLAMLFCVLAKGFAGNLEAGECRNVLAPYARGAT
jgi:hypothetical protein